MITEIWRDLDSCVGARRDRAEGSLGSRLAKDLDRIHRLVPRLRAALPATRSGRRRPAADQRAPCVQVLRQQHHAVVPEGFVGLLVTDPLWFAAGRIERLREKLGGNAQVWVDPRSRRGAEEPEGSKGGAQDE